MPWITEAVLLVRVVVVFNLTSNMWRMVCLLGFPIVVKITRAVIIIIFLVQWRRDTSNVTVNQFNTTQSLSNWTVKAGWILELFDNGYLCILHSAASIAQSADLIIAVTLHFCFCGALEHRHICSMVRK